MEWTPGGVSEDVEDRRDETGGGGPQMGGLGPVHLGLGGTLVLLALSMFFGRDFLSLFQGVPMDSGPTQSPVQRSAGNPAAEQRSVQFVSFVLDDAQKTWEQVLPQQTNRPYRHAKLVLFRDAVQSACGTAESSTGPFYCPGDEKVYIDLGFYDELAQRFGAPGEFAQAYVITHEIGHHLQKILGIESQVRQAQERNPGAQNQYSVRLELQADCFAGVWGKSTEQRHIINTQDIDEGLRAAAAIGDDRLQRMAGRSVSPERFTHGSSAQRVEWFRRGLEQGRIDACNTFAQ